MIVGGLAEVSDKGLTVLADVARLADLDRAKFLRRSRDAGKLSRRRLELDHAMSGSTTSRASHELNARRMARLPTRSPSSGEPTLPVKK